MAKMSLLVRLGRGPEKIRVQHGKVTLQFNINLIQVSLLLMLPYYGELLWWLMVLVHYNPPMFAKFQSKSK